MHNDHTAPTGSSHGSLKAYILGFGLSILLTVIPFALVMHPVVSKTSIIAAIILLAVVQVLVHLVYFLHMNGTSEQRWNLTAFTFTVLVVVLLVGGSLWIMANTTNNLMPIPDLTHQE